MEIVMVHSYKGGSGKTLLSYNLALTLSKQNQRVLLIEGDLDGPVFHNNFSDLSPTKYINQYLKDPKELDSYIVKNGSFDLIFASPDFASQDLMRNRDYESLLENIIQIKEQINSLPYDYVLIDLSPG
jgi:flagellar biosynthesis protein FlhG